MGAFRRIYLLEKTSLLDMRNSFDKVFPHSNTDLPVVSSNEVDYGLQMLCRGEVKSEKGDKNHKTTIQIYRNDKNKPYDTNCKCELRCDCNAFRYNVAYPLIKNNNFFSKPSANMRIPNRVNNPGQVTTYCKHLYSYLKYLINKNKIKFVK